MEDTGDYFSLKWSNFRSSLTEGFHDFLQEEAMVDVTLAAEGKFVQAHKLVLSVCSPYFKNLFEVNPCKHPIVFLKDVALNDLSYMLDFMYKGEVGVKHDDLPSFLKLADTLKVKGLAGEKIQNENCSLKGLDSNIARVRKKANRDSVSDVNKENSEFQSSSEKKVSQNKRRKFQCKSKSVKKIKSVKCDNESVDKSADKSSDHVSEDEDNNPLIKFVGGDSVKSGGSSKQSESQCDNENESQCDSKMNFSVWNDDVAYSDDSGGPDINSLFQSDYSEEAESAPQDEIQTLERLNGLLHVILKGMKGAWVCSRGNTPGGRRETMYFCETNPDAFPKPSAIRSSPIWHYYDKVQDMAICRICRKPLKGPQTTQAEYHLRAKHPYETAEFVKQKAEWLKKRRKVLIPGVGIF